MSQIKTAAPVEDATAQTQTIRYDFNTVVPSSGVSISKEMATVTLRTRAGWRACIRQPHHSHRNLKRLKRKQEKLGRFRPDGLILVGIDGGAK